MNRYKVKRIDVIKNNNEMKFDINYLTFRLHIQVRCQRKQVFDNGDVLEWSGIPVCYPSKLVTPEHWSRVKLARYVIRCIGK